MKKLISAPLLLLVLVGCGSSGGSTGGGSGGSTSTLSQTGSSSTSSLANNSSSTTTTTTTTTTSTGTRDISSLLGLFVGTSLTWSTSTDRVQFSSQDLPNHRSCYWPLGNPLYQAYNGTNPLFSANSSLISSHTFNFSIPRFPSEASSKTATSLGAIGIARNGVSIYNQYNGAGQPLSGEINSFDQFLGHPDPGNKYHYHVEPSYLTGVFGKDAFLGLLLDGFPVYGPVENGVTLTNANLDAYHGHFGVTADFPNGIYHYHVTADSPYINGGSFFGSVGTVSQ